VLAFTTRVVFTSVSCHRARAAVAAATIALSAFGPVAARPAVAQAVPAGPIASLVRAERDFARLSRDSGTYVAFRANLDSSGIVFQPRAVNGQAWYAAHPPTGARTATLFWTPTHNAVAASGDLGFSIGPFRIDGRRGKDTVSAGGTFASVWGRRPGEPWRVLVDLGVGDTVTTHVDTTVLVTHAAPGVAPPARASASSIGDVLRADTALGRSYGDAAARDGLAARAAADVRILRDGVGSTVGRDAARAAAERVGTRFRSAPITGALAAAGDLAYTYGTYTLDAADPSATREEGNYLRVWRRATNGWTLVLDVAAAVPPSA
jgi:ketosteroid isomerase-like protein